MTEWPNRSRILCCSVAQSCSTLCSPVYCSTPGFSVLHQLPESSETHIHRIGDAIPPSHPLSPPSPPSLNLSQHQGLFQCFKLIRGKKNEIKQSITRNIHGKYI